MKERDAFRDFLRRVQGDAEAARQLLSDAMSCDKYTTQQIAAAQRIISNAILAADRLDIYERIDEIEAELAKFKTPR